jgi:hypothetical protein
MASAYPGALDTFATNRVDATVSATTHALDHNNANDALNKIEGELGINPSGAFATVAARLTDIEADIAAGSGGLVGTAPDWTVANHTTDRNLDQDNWTLDEVVNCLCTLVTDLITRGVLQ